MWFAEGRLAVAIHHLDVSLISRGKGHAVTAAAAYRAGVRLVDERTGEAHDYRRRSGVNDKVILTPAGAEPWARDRGTLWNRAEIAESRCDAQVGRSWVFALPRELDPATNQRLGREFFERHLVSRGMVVDLAFHELDGDNPHVHGLSTLRELDGAGFAPRKNRSWNDKKLLLECREGSAALINRYLQDAKVPRDEWVSDRTLRAQLTTALAQCDYERAARLCRVPTKHVGTSATAVAARGEASTRAEDLDGETKADAERIDRMRREVEIHPEQVAQLREEVLGLEGRLDVVWRDVAEEKEIERRTRREAVESKPVGRDLFEGKLTGLDPGWRDRDTPRVWDIDAALTCAEKEIARIEAETRRRAEEEEHVERRTEAEAAARAVGLDIAAVYGDAEAKKVDPVAVLERATAAEEEWFVAAARAAGLDDAVTERIRDESESKARGSGWAAVSMATRDRIERQEAAEVAAAKVLVNVDAVYRRAGERNEDVLDALERATKEAKPIVAAARAAGLDDAATERIRDESESKARGSGWAAVSTATRDRIERQEAAEVAAAKVLVNVDAVYRRAGERNEDVLDALERATKEAKPIVAAARAAGLDDAATERIRDESESKARGSGWAAVSTATRDRIERQEAAEVAAAKVLVNVDAVYRRAGERNEDVLDALERATKEAKPIVAAARAAGLDDAATERIRDESESKARGSGWAAVSTATRDRIERQEAAEVAAAKRVERARRWWW